MPRSNRVVHYLILAMLAIILAGCSGGNESNSQPQIVAQETITTGDSTEIAPTATPTALRELPPTWTPVPSLTPVPPRPTMVITRRPTHADFVPPTWTPKPGAASENTGVPDSPAPAVASGPTASPTPFRTDLALITPANAAQLTEIGRLEEVLVNDLVWSPDGLKLAAAMQDGVRLYTQADFDNMPRLLADSPSTENSLGFAVEAVAFSPDGNLVAHTNSDGELHVWEYNRALDTYSKLYRIDASTSTLWDVAFSPDSTRIVTSDDFGFLKVWDVETRQILLELDSEGGVVHDLAVYPPSAFVVVSSAGNSRAKVWNLDDGTEFAEITGHSAEARAVAFDPTGNTFATGGNEGSVRIWTIIGAQEQNPEATLDGHGSIITSIAYSGNSSLMAVGVNTGMVHIWDLSTNEELVRFEAHDPWITTIAWSPDGTALFTTGMDSTVRAWGIPIDS